MATFLNVKSAMFAGPLSDAGTRLTAFMRNNPFAEIINTMAVADMAGGFGALWVVFTTDDAVDTTGVNAYRDNENPLNDFDA